MRLWNLKQWWRNLGNVGGLFLVATFLDDGLRSLLYWRLQLEVVADPWGALRERPAVQAAVRRDARGRDGDAAARVRWR